MNGFVGNFPVGDAQSIPVTAGIASDLVELPHKDSQDIMIVNLGAVNAFVRVGSIGSPVPANGLLDWQGGGAVDGDNFTINGRTYTYSDDLAAAFASSELMFSGPASAFETVTLGSDVYTYQSAIAAAVVAEGLLTMTAVPTDGETLTIGARTYTFRAELLFGGKPFEVLIGPDISTQLQYLELATNAAPQALGTVIGLGTAPNDQAIGSGKPTTLEVVAILAGTNGNLIVTTETMANSSWGAGTLTGGDFPAAFDILATGDADADLQNFVFAITGANIGAGTLYGEGTPPNADASAAMHATLPGVMVATALVAGVGGNAIPTLDTFATGSWTGATMAGGVDAAAPDTLFTDGTADTSILAMVAGINADPTQEGILFGVGTTKNSDVSAENQNPLVEVFSKLIGSGGNGQGTTSSIISGSEWDDPTLLAGLDAFGAVVSDLNGMPVIAGEKGVYNIGKDLFSTNRPLAIAFITAAGTTDLQIVQGHGS